MLSRRGFLGRAAATVAGGIVASGLQEVRGYVTPAMVLNTESAPIEKLNEVFFVIDRETIVRATVTNRHEDGRLDLDVVAHPQSAFASRTKFCRVRRATLKDLEPTQSTAGTWFVTAAELRKVMGGPSAEEAVARGKRRLFGRST